MYSALNSTQINDKKSTKKTTKEEKKSEQEEEKKPRKIKPMLKTKYNKKGQK
ncbi:hypothetical protein HanIR_Chr02g0084831 [Helianthus annuus]|nr:hypothetical protein HanIR_Chr02g0084831 [Helianthus annuus]